MNEFTSDDNIAKSDNWDFTLNVKWLLLRVDSAEIEDRVHALESLEPFLRNIYERNSRLTVTDDSLRIPISFAILTRCDDISPRVRAKALTILSNTIHYVLNVLEETRDQAALEVDDFCGVNEDDLYVNGNHRIFWHFLPSFEERKKELNEIINRRVYDAYANVRRIALLALEKILVVDETYLIQENLKHFGSSCEDINSYVKRQSIMSLSVILNTYQENYQIQDLWLKCILPLIDDSENFVQMKALSALEHIFLFRLFSPSYDDRKFALTILMKLASADFLAFQQFFKKAFCMWKSMDKLKTETVDRLRAYIDTEIEEYAWFYISYFSFYCPLSSGFSSLCIERLIVFQRTGQYHPIANHVLKTFLNIFQNVSLETLEKIENIISCGLATFSFCGELIPPIIEILLKIHHHKGTIAEFAAFSSALFQKCQEFLSDIISQGASLESVSDELLAKHFCTIAEFCHYNSSYLTPSVIRILKYFSDCNEPSMIPLSTIVKAHALTTLGKLCLQDKNLAIELIPMIENTILKSGTAVIRNNASVILFNICQRYSCYVDKCMPLIIRCFKDEVPVIRYQAIGLTIHLLQNEYLKWVKSLFFGLLSSLTDKEKKIRELGKYSLLQLLPEQKKPLFFDCFIDSIFVLNCFSPPDNERITKYVKRLELFSAPGDDRREERMIIYIFLLESMSIKERGYLVKLIGEMLSNVAESVFPLLQKTECIVRDCFAILSCNEIRTNDLNIIENIDEESENELRKTELNIRKAVLVEPIIPVVINLKNILMDSESDLTRDTVSFLKDFLSDFKDDISDILAGDKSLQKLLELEIKNDAERERLTSRNSKDMQRKNKQLEEKFSATVTLNDIQKLMGKSYINLEASNNQRKRKQSCQPVSILSRGQTSTSENSEINETCMTNSESDMEC